MEREIKFRGLRMDGEGWVYGNLLKHNDSYIQFSDYDGVFESYHKVIPDSVGQYTGLKDRFDNEIYEGDKIKVLYTDWPSNSQNEITLDQYLDSISSDGIVKFVFDSWVIELKNRYDEDYHSSIDVGKHGRLTVIGNIHEIID